jgi:predicted RNA binding protein YcfA (HicA-like mRNA interferase family)
MKPLPYREVQRKLEQAGFVKVSQKGRQLRDLLRQKFEAAERKAIDSQG